jgi:aspartate-semialdehyde dehydrogenase
LETERTVDLTKARAILEAAPGVQLVDDPEQNLYPMPLTATGKYDVEVGRLRQSLAFGDHGLEFFVCGDQLLRGAALNAVLVAEAMHTNGALTA